MYACQTCPASRRIALGAQAGRGVLVDRTSSKDNGMGVLPLGNLDRKGGAPMVLRQRLRRALRVAIVRGNAISKLSQLH